MTIQYPTRREGLFGLGALVAASALPRIALAREPQTFWFGADLSYVNEVEDCGAVYRVGDQVRDPFQIFADTGHNLVRVRLWNDAEWTNYSDLPDVKKTIRRAKDAGMKVLLDFHYSDDWADGDKQIIPRAWAAIRDDVPALSQAVHDYTLSTLKSLAADDLSPDMVQVGNETNPEVMTDAEWKSRHVGIDWARNAALLNAGIAAVREAGRESGHPAVVMLHIAQPENVEPWFAAAAAHGLTDFDQIGISYYRKWSTQDLAGLAAVIGRLRTTYPAVQVMVVETSYPFTTESADELPNLLGPDTLLDGYPASYEGQLKYMIDITQTVMDAGGNGVVYWEPAWVTSSCQTRWGRGSSWENATFFDWRRGNALVPAAGYIRHPYRRPA